LTQINIQKLKFDKKMSFNHRFYRDFTDAKRWKTYRAAVETTDLYIKESGNHSVWVEKIVSELRDEIKKHIQQNPEFLHSLTPVKHVKNAHPIILKMNKAAEKAGVGPMAAVAGAIAEFVGFELLKKSKEVIVENGGDIFLKLEHSGIITIFAGNSPFSQKIGIKIYPEKTPLSICTSSGVIGHSLSKGKANAATIISKDAALADAVATEAANLINSENDFETALDYALNIKGVLGAVLIFKDKLAVKGDVEFITI
jgi:uncharacterized protein